MTMTDASCCACAKARSCCGRRKRLPNIIYSSIVAVQTILIGSISMRYISILYTLSCWAASAAASSASASAAASLSLGIGNDVVIVAGRSRRRSAATVTAFAHSSSRSMVFSSTIQKPITVRRMNHPISLPLPGHHRSNAARERLIMAATATTFSNDIDNQQSQLPQVFATGYSSNPSLSQALREAIEMAASNLPPPSTSTTSSNTKMIDLAIVFVSSLYDDISTVLVPQLLQSVMENTMYEGGVRHVLGCTAGGIIGSTTTGTTTKPSHSNSSASTMANNNRMRPIESESTPAISVTFALLPEVQINTFYVDGRDVPDIMTDDYRYSDTTTQAMASSRWKKAMGIVDENNDGDSGDDNDNDTPIFMILPSPAFQNNLDDFLRGMRYAYPHGQVLGGLASTVSSLSRARIFSYSSSSSSLGKECTRGDGCVGIMLRGDIQVDTMVAQGAKPVGGVYRVVATGGDGRKRTTSSFDGGETSDSGAYDEACRSTIGAIVLDEDATIEDAMEADDKNDDDDARKEEDGGKEEESKDAKRAKLLADYAKARIPKPPLAEANFVMKSLSDDDRAYMRRALLIGLERSGLVGRTPNELLRLAKGEGHRFTVRQVASAGMKDGSVTFPLGSVNVNVGDRCRFFVRDGEFARREVEALWMGYKKKELKETLMGGNDGSTTSPPTACFVLPTLDRGAKLFGGKAGYESGTAADFLPGISSISGFFTNGVLGRLDGTVAGATSTMTADSSFDENDMLHGSSSQYVVFRSKSRRPFYSPQQAAVDAIQASSMKKEEEAVEEVARRTPTNDAFGGAPRSENGELIVRRREIHSGRAMSVSTVEWSVAEKTAKPTSALEGYMWEKETQVDRMRERFPLAQVMSQTKAAMIDPRTPKPRDWIGQVKRAGADGNFVIIPECKRMEPVSGSLRKRYDIANLVKQLTLAGAPALSVNSDGVLFGGSMDDIKIARESSSSAAVTFDSNDNDGVVAPPVLASDLLLYPYQLYKLRLAGADAVSLVVGALERKDLTYLTKIAKTIQLQVVASVTSEVQITMLTELDAGSISALIVSNRDLETFGFDSSGRQALTLLQSDAIALFREKNGKEVPILIEGRVGIVGAADGDSVEYIKSLKGAGAFGAIVGGGLAEIEDGDVAESIISWSL